MKSRRPTALFVTTLLKRSPHFDGSRPMVTLQQQLPSLKQAWGHSTVVSRALLEKAPSDERITAIETDVLLAYDTTNNDDSSTTNDGMMIPITAHPPDTESDLSVRVFLERVMIRGGKKTTKHHIKLDFKQQQVIQPTLKLLHGILHQEHETDIGCDESNNSNRTFFLNADVLPGPGQTENDLAVRAKPFLDDCERELLRHYDTTKNDDSSNNAATPPGAAMAFSLGWKVDVCCPSGYLANHVEEMNRVIKDIEVPVVLAVNARLLAKSPPEPFLAFLRSPAPQGQRQLLVWTGAGEPPIGLYTLRRVQEMFAGVSDQVGYDVQTTNNTMEAVLYDTVMYFLGWKNILVRKWKRSAALVCSWWSRTKTTKTTAQTNNNETTGLLK